MVKETPIQRVEYLLSQVKREEGRISAAESLQHALSRTLHPEGKARPTEKGWRFWFKTKAHSPYFTDTEKWAFDMSAEEIEVFLHWLTRYQSDRAAAKKRYEEQILHPDRG